MASLELLEGVLEGSQVPHQPLLIMTETVTQSGLPIFTEVLRRSEQAWVSFPTPGYRWWLRGRGSVLVTALHSSKAIQPRGSTSRLIDLTDSVPEYGTPTEGLSGLEKRIRTECEVCIYIHESGWLVDESAGEKASIYIDAIDILAEDYSISGTMRLFRNLLQLVKDSKCRLHLILPRAT